MWKKDETPKAPPGRADFSSPVETAKPSGSRSLIGPSLIIDGAVKGTEDLLVEGRVDGEISLQENTVTIGENGKVKARVEARIIIVEGSVEGDLLGGEQIEIRRSGNVLGNITAPRVGLEDGAQFKGNIDMSPRKKPSPQPVSAPKSNNDKPAGTNPDKKLSG